MLLLQVTIIQADMDALAIEPVLCNVRLLCTSTSGRKIGEIVALTKRVSEMKEFPGYPLKSHIYTTELLFFYLDVAFL